MFLTYDLLICLIKLTYHLLRFLLCHFLQASHSLSALRAYLEPFTLILSNHLLDAYPLHFSACCASSLSLFLLPQGSWNACFTTTSDVARIQECVVIRDMKSMPIFVSSVKISALFTITSIVKRLLSDVLCITMLFFPSSWLHSEDSAYTINLMCVQLHEAAFYFPSLD